MNFSAQLAKQFRDVHFGGNWTDSCLQDQLADVTWEEATAQVHGLNSIAALLYHVNYFVGALLQVLRKDPLTAHDRFSFDLPPIRNTKEWKSLQEKCWEEAKSAALLLEQLPDHRLSEDFSETKYGTYYRNIHGIIEHIHYHLGQIALLKKILRQQSVSAHKHVVEKYIAGFNATDHEVILSCLTEDVVWDMPGFFYHEGKTAFDKEIENDAFTGSPVIALTRLVEEGNAVIAEGTVKAHMKNGGLLDAEFCDVFLFEKGKIKKLTTYLMNRNKAG